MLIEHAFTLFFANGLCTLQHAKAEKPYVAPQDTVWHWKVSGASTSQNHMAKLLFFEFLEVPVLQEFGVEGERFYPSG